MVALGSIPFLGPVFFAFPPTWRNRALGALPLLIVAGIVIAHNIDIGESRPSVIQLSGTAPVAENIDATRVATSHAGDQLIDDLKGPDSSKLFDLSVGTEEGWTGRFDSNGYTISSEQPGAGRMWELTPPVADRRVLSSPLPRLQPMS